MEITDKEYRSLVAQSSQYRIILRFLKAGGLDNYLRDRRLLPIDLVQTPDDESGGTSINLFLKSIADECNLMDKKITSLSSALVDSVIALSKANRKNIPKKSLMNRIQLFIGKCIHDAQ